MTRIMLVAMLLATTATLAASPGASAGCAVGWNPYDFTDVHGNCTLQGKCVRVVGVEHCYDDIEIINVG